jgi:hypothetical protein
MRTTGNALQTPEALKDTQTAKYFPRKCPNWQNPAMLKEMPA